MVKEETLFAAPAKYGSNAINSTFSAPQNMSSSPITNGDINGDTSFPSTINNNLGVMEDNHIGRTIKTALLKAQAESRVIVGLGAAIKVLSKTPDRSLFCLMAVPQDGDSATHMHEVLLEAFCYENDIYVIKVDCPTKLSRILGKNTVETCCLVQKTSTSNVEANNAIDNELINKSETILVDYCEAFWDSPHSPVVQLPAV